MFVKGMKKPEGSGRKKDELSYKTARAILRDLKCDPIEGMARIAMDKKTPKTLQGRMFAELAKYSHPALKAIEHSGLGGGAIGIDVLYGESDPRSILLGRMDELAARTNQGASDKESKP